MMAKLIVKLQALQNQVDELERRLGYLSTKRMVFQREIQRYKCSKCAQIFHPFEDQIGYINKLF